MAITFEWENFLLTVSDFMGIEKNELKPDTHIYNDLGIDSLGMFSLGMNLIKTYEIKLPLSQISTVATIKDLYDSMKKYLIEKNPE
jgi:acyl carrier protein